MQKYVKMFAKILYAFHTLLYIINISIKNMYYNECNRRSMHFLNSTVHIGLLSLGSTEGLDTSPAVW